MRPMVALLTLALSSGCAGFSEPLMDPQVAWNKQLPRGHDYPCPDPLVFPYYQGVDEYGPICTTRPLDYNFEDIDTLTVP